MPYPLCIVLGRNRTATSLLTKLLTMSIEEIPIIKRRSRPQPRVRELSIEGDDTEVADINEAEDKLL